MRCPDCAGQTTRIRHGAAAYSSAMVPRVTYFLIGVNLLVFLADLASGSGGMSSSGRLAIDLGLFGPAVGDGEWYRLITSGFMHAGLIHIGFNMFALYILGPILEPALGHLRFAALYFASLLVGSFGVILLSPNDLTVGASGAIFGLFAATFVIARGRGLTDVASQIGMLLVLNLVITFTLPGISVGAHLFGAMGGAICALLIVAGDRGLTGENRVLAETGAMVLMAAAAFVLAIAIAPDPFGALRI